ncbi:MAG: type II secretion system protein GspL [Burkholderiaceae bacterium]|jgi:general secretion pathway protein L
MSTARIRSFPGWPTAGLLLRAPSRRSDGTPEADQFGFLAFKKDVSTKRGRATLDRIPTQMPAVLLLAPDDVLLTSARVPPVPAGRLREALPNLLEDAVLGDAAGLHIAVGAKREDANTIAAVNRAWMRRQLERLTASGQRVTAVLPESLCVPLLEGAWSLVVSFEEGVVRNVWVRTGVQDAQPLPTDPAAAGVVLELILAQTDLLSRPHSLDLYVPKALEGRWRPVTAVITDDVRVHHGTPLRAWIAQGGPDLGVNAPVSLLQHEFAERVVGRAALHRWGRVLVLVAALFAVQLLALQWQWAGLRSEARSLRADEEAMFRSAFPDTKVVLDPMLQMNRELAGLRAGAGRTDQGDFSAMVPELARLFSTLPANSLRQLNYDARVLKVRFAPGTLVAQPARDAMVKRAAADGYDLRFEGDNAQGQSGFGASLKPKAGA